MAMNAAIKLGLEALRVSLDDDLNNDAVEIAVLDADGYRELPHDETIGHINRLKPLEGE